ncbi:MAG: putative glycoside hydrolase [Bacillota bacterium]
MRGSRFVRGVWPLRVLGRVLPALASILVHAEAAAATPSSLPPPAPARPVPVLRGIYLPAGRLLQGVSDAEWAAWIESGINAVVVDLKNDEGWVLAPVDVPEVSAFKARWSPGLDLAGFTARARRDGFYPVARIVALRDNRAGRARPDLALRSRSGEVWRGAKGERWLDPRRAEVRRYIAELAVAASRMGFAEVHLDYVRFPSEGPLHRLAWPSGASKVDAVAGLISAVAEALAPTDTLLSAAVFGQACVLEGDMGIGQRCESVAGQVDVVAPMAYPSHYARGSFGLAVPERAPGRTVERTLARTTARVERARVRPWLQAFTLRVPYGAVELAEQIRAAEAAGTAGWFLWNPYGVYPYLQTAMELARRPVASAGAPWPETPSYARAGER